MSNRFGSPVRSLALLVAFAIWLPSPAAAHQVWIEQDQKGARLHFGEYGLNLKEASPGYLDKLKQPLAWLRSASGKQTLTLRRHKRGLHLPGKAEPGQALLVEARDYPLLAGHGEKPTKTRWTPAARYVGDLRARTVAELTLDLLPTGKAGQFVVMFRNKPLEGSKVTLTAESGWELAATSDDTGKVQFRLPWRSAYVVHTRHKEPQPGSRKTAKGQEHFDSSSFSTSLSFDTTSGLPAPARPEAKPANKMKPTKDKS